ncbi:hypothetical protein PV325_005093, partial [Microctonus aethiopoides]
MNYCNAIIIISILFQIHLFNAVDVDPHKTIAWGPGLNPEKIVMRARYFFLQLVDVNGKNLTESPGEKFISTEIKGQNKNSHSCRIWTQILDCKDGSFIIRYRLYETCSNLQIIVKLKDTNVKPVSISTKGPVYEEECYCPNPSVDVWLDDYTCAQNYSQILEDLKYFPKINFDEIRNEIIKEYNKPHSFNSILLSLTRKVVLPDLEFFMNLGDWPLVLKNKNLYPIFSWCGSSNTIDIILPTYDITQSSMESMGSVMLDMLSIQGNIKTPWKNKTEKVFWRGRDSRRERLDLIDIARKYPDLFNVSITNFFFFQNEIEKYGPGEKHVSFFDFFKYKYQLNIDGSVAAYRFPYLLAGDSVVLKQDSEYYEYFYNHTIPYVHFIPVKKDLSDIVEKIDWIKEHDDEAFKIAKAGRVLMRDVAMPRDVFCYHVSLFR